MTRIARYVAPPSREEQKQRLEFLVKEGARTDDACNYGALLFIDRPGDVCFLAPVFPEFRGIEIVSASPKRLDGKDYDIWDHDSGKMVQPAMTAKAVIKWLQANAKKDQEVHQNIVQWAEDVFRYYNIPTLEGR